MTTNIVSNTPESFKNEFRTPPAIFEWGRSLIGGIDFDTACRVNNWLARPVWNARLPQNLLDTRMTDDALSVEWIGRCWCNPPYDDIEPWIEHAIACKDAITAMLIPSPNGEDRYDLLASHAHEIGIIGRLAFLAGGDYVIKGKNGKPDRHVKEGEPQSGNTRGSSLFIINGYGQGSRSFITRDEIFARFGNSKRSV